MFQQEDIGKQVRARTLDGESIEGELTDVQPEDAYITPAGADDARKVPFNTITTVTRIGEFGGE